MSDLSGPRSSGSSILIVCVLMFTGMLKMCVVDIISKEVASYERSKLLCSTVVVSTKQKQEMCRFVT